MIYDLIVRMGAAKALTGGREITEKLIPAVARLAQVGDNANDDDDDDVYDHDDVLFQDGSLEARIYAKMTLKLLMEHPDFDRVLKKNVTANTLRNLEKILDSVRNNGMSSASSRKRRLTSNGRATAPNRGKTL